MARNKVHPLCKQHQDGLRVTESTCKYYEIGLCSTGSRSVCAAVRYGFGLYAKHGFNNCEKCTRDFVHKYFYTKTDAYIYGTCEYSGNIASVHWRVLAERLPQAKFILTYRPVVDWWESCKTKARKGFSSKWASLARKQPINWAGLYNVIHFNGIKMNESLWKYEYQKYFEEVQTYFGGSDRLLVMDVVEGSDQERWNKLAKFFGKTPPLNREFPRIRGILKRVY